MTSVPTVLISTVENEVISYDEYRGQKNAFDLHKRIREIKPKLVQQVNSKEELEEIRLEVPHFVIIGLLEPKN